MAGPSNSSLIDKLTHVSTAQLEKMAEPTVHRCHPSLTLLRSYYARRIAIDCAQGVAPLRLRNIVRTFL
jgi:hypothetical protein